MIKKISAENIKELRNKTGAGMMDCKKALEATEGKIDLAIENLRKKGLASANKKSTRVATEGLIESYIHAGSRIGVLVELNCETDFVARQEQFHNLAKNIAMQVAACQFVEYVSIHDIPETIVIKEKNLEMDKDDIINKPEEIKKQIVKGRIRKRLQELSLMDQPFIKNPEISVEELVKQHIALLGENIKVRRFQRFLLGEGLEKKVDDFTQEVSNIISGY
uniref:Multifunctional fusion protein n=1 Tax=Dipterocladia arabiensis TaxID=2007176 RepID=A0A1Z1M0H6_9FLOR|nr:translation elongation factor Ts [Dipterocladia arabiensis]ARW59380.1 translation elongation factor Ts [Dipterocladia arabiensis]